MLCFLLYSCTREVLSFRSLPRREYLIQRMTTMNRAEQKSATEEGKGGGLGRNDEGGNGSVAPDSSITADEEELIVRLHKLLGNRWALIAGRLPWRTSEEIEKYWKMRRQEYKTGN